MLAPPRWSRPQPAVQRRTGQQPLVKPYVRMSRIRLPSTFTAHTLHRLGGAPPGGPTAPARAGGEAHPET